MHARFCLMEPSDSGLIVNMQEPAQAVAINLCIQCSGEIDPSSFSFEMRLVSVDNFCRRCWDGVISDKDIDIQYLERPKWLQARSR
jgi:hypothetical protein